MRRRHLPQQGTGDRVETAPHPARRRGAPWLQGPRDRVAVRVRGVHPLPVDGRTPLEPTCGAPWAGLGHPPNGAGIGIEGPVLPALLAGADEVLRLALSCWLDREQRWCLAEVEVRTGRIRAEVPVTDERDAVDRPCVVWDG